MLAVIQEIKNFIQKPENVKKGDKNTETMYSIIIGGNAYPFFASFFDIISLGLFCAHTP